MPGPDGGGRQPASDLPDPVVNTQGSEGLGNGFVQRLRRHVERVLCLVQVVDDDGAGLERHKIDLAYSFFVRLRSGWWPVIGKDKRRE